MPEARLTILITTYRRPQLLARAIRSVIAQTFTDWHLVIFDNASGDDTASTVKSFAQIDDRIKFVSRDRNIGAFKNIRSAFYSVNTELFAFFSDDDFLLPHCLATAVDGLDSHAHVMASGGRVAVVDLDGVVLLTAPPRPWPSRTTALESCLQIASSNFPIPTSLVFRRSVLLHKNFFPDQDDFISSDGNWLFYAALGGGIHISDQITAAFTAHAGSVSSGKDPQFLFDYGQTLMRAIQTQWYPDSAHTFGEEAAVLIERSAMIAYGIPRMLDAWRCARLQSNADISAKCEMILVRDLSPLAVTARVRIFIEMYACWIPRVIRISLRYLRRILQSISLMHRKSDNTDEIARLSQKYMSVPTRHAPLPKKQG